MSKARTLLLTAGGIAVASVLTSQPVVPFAATYKVVAWNDLGMHCIDDDYSVYSLLPPFNNLQAQVIDSTGKLVKDPVALGIKVEYQATADPAGSINTTSAGKTNFWSFVKALYESKAGPDQGLAGSDMPGVANAPQRMAFDGSRNVFRADGIPITPYDDAGHLRTYPMLRVVVRTAGNQELASTKVVLPVSDEMQCTLCHASGGPTAGKPFRGWAWEKDWRRDYRINILRKHDELNTGDPRFDKALQDAGYNPLGLEATVVQDNKPVLCARCHATEALPGHGTDAVSKLTSAMHRRHAVQKDPRNGLTLDASANRTACYACHPGTDTKCMRGVMGSSVASDGSLAMQCQSCHGNMSAVGAVARTGWLEEPACQSCHTGTAVQNSGGLRFTDAFDSVTGKPRVAANATFATTPNVPAPGLSLYRFSAGHGGMACEACHGSTHAEYPSAHQNDNVQSNALQGHAGVLVECLACHATTPASGLGGPHGMHPIGQGFASDHESATKIGGVTLCRACHGTDYRGTVLSAAFAPRSFSTKFGAVSYAKGAMVGCYNCHNGPGSETATTNTAPVAQNAAAATVDTPVATTLVATDANSNPLVYRISQQPAHGRVGLVGNVATYVPDPGFAGTDTYQFLAFDNSIDSKAGTVTVTRGATWAGFGTGYASPNKLPPALSLDARPILGTNVGVVIGGTAPAPGAAYLLLSYERARAATEFGGALLVEPSLVVPVAVPVSGPAATLPIPNVPALAGVVLQMQAVVSDPSAKHLLVFTGGVTLALGS